MDRVKPLKIEKISGGGSQDNLYPQDLNPNEDGVEARGLVIQNDTSDDANVEVTRDSSNRMTFKDGENSTPLTLTDLLSGEGGGDDDQVKVSVAEGDTFTIEEGNQQIIYEEFTIEGELIVDGEQVIFDCVGADTAEANTASNVGTGGVGIYKQKTGVDLEFKKLNAGSSKVTITDDTGNSEVDVDVVPGNIAHQDLSGAGTNTHAQVDTHIANTSNPHSTDVGNIGSGTLAELNSAITDATLDDSSSARTPSTHATSHQSGGGDAIKLDDLSAADDNTDLNATTSAHGLLPKLGGGTTNFLRADGTWAAPVSLVAFSAYDDSWPEIEFTTTFTDLDLTVETKKTTGFTHSTVTNPEEVTIANAGVYKIDLQITTGVTSASAANAQIRLVKDSGSGYSEIAGSLAHTYSVDDTNGYTTAAVSMILDLAAGDKIKAQAARYNGTATMKFVSDSSRLTILKLF